MIRFEMQSGDTIDIELYPEEAPKTCENFEKLVREGFFDGIHFHRIVPGFVIQGGDPTGTGTGGSKQNIPGEFRTAGVDNKISHEKGVLSMARSGSYTYGFDTASSQFFICLDDSCKALDGMHGLFEERAREHGIHLIWVTHDLFDPRVISRQGVRQQVNDYMRTVMQEEPVDPSLEILKDEKSW